MELSTQVAAANITANAEIWGNEDGTVSIFCHSGDRFKPICASLKSMGISILNVSGVENAHQDKYQLSDTLGKKKISLWAQQNLHEIIDVFDKTKGNPFDDIKLILDAEGVRKLIEAGVQHPVIQAIAGQDRTFAARVVGGK